MRSRLQHLKPGIARNRAKDRPCLNASGWSFPRVAIVILMTILAGLPVRADDLGIVYKQRTGPRFSQGKGEAVGGILPGLLEGIIAKAMGKPVKAKGMPWTQAQAFVRRGRTDAIVTVPTRKRLEYAMSNEVTVFTLAMRPTVLRGSEAHRLLTDAPEVASLRKTGGLRHHRQRLG